MNHGQDTISGEVVRSLCDTFEELLGTYHSHTDAAGNRYDSPEVLLEDLIEQLRATVPEPEAEEDEETDEERIKRWKKLDREKKADDLIKTALNDEGDSRN